MAKQPVKSITKKALKLFHLLSKTNVLSKIACIM